MPPMTGLPRISVVVPSYNQGRFLVECFESITAQGYPELELIVMDGGSTDESVEIIRRYEPVISYWQSQRDGGQSAAINAGAARATGDLVAWLNSDDLYCAEALWVVACAWQKHPGHGLYIGNGLRLNEATKHLTPFHRRHMALHRRSLKEGVDYLLQPSVFFDRAAWNEAGGLDPALHFCMDWDMFIRVADRHPAVTINEFLSISREYEDTKTASGGLRRSAELCEMARRHTGQNMTLGGSLYLMETILQSDLSGSLGDKFRQLIREAKIDSERKMPALSGTDDGFPELSDGSDATYVPLAGSGVGPDRPTDPYGLPRITVITPSFNQAEYLERTLKSLIDQRYPNLEMIVMDGGSTDGSVEVIRRYEAHLTHWQSGSDKGPADAINQGLALASGEIVSWLNSDDMLAEGALWKVARAFGDDPELDMAFGNAMYVDAHDAPWLADHGRHRTALYYGEIQPVAHVPAYWSYVHAIPQPATFFRKSLLDRSGVLNEQFHFIFDFELFFRFQFHARKVQKLEALLAFYRIHDLAKTASWQSFLVELYRFSRAWWPAVGDRGFASTRDHFLDAFMPRYWGARKRGWLYGAHRAAISWIVTHKQANPEEILLRRERRRPPPPALAGPLLQQALVASAGADAGIVPPTLPRRTARYNVAFCSYFLPRFPGFSGGEIRDFHILRDLLGFCRISFFASHATTGAQQIDLLSPEFERFCDPDTLKQDAPGDLQLGHLDVLLTRAWRALEHMRKAGWPLVGPKLPRDVGINARYLRAHAVGAVRRVLNEDNPDFLFVSPQNNMIALALNKAVGTTRFVLATYDVEKVRLERLRDRVKGLRRVAGQLEAERGARFERDNIALYDGVIAVSELDKTIFVETYGLDPERVCVVENGVDTNYFQFEPRDPRHAPVVTFVASFGYEPNHFAALRLIRAVMPLVWQQRPDAQLWLVGQMPLPELAQLADNRRIFVTGKVPSVRSFLKQAAVMCAPLQAGSGTKYKVLEALSAGVPVVCTALAAEGLELESGTHLVIADSDAALASELLTLLDAPDKAAALAVRGRSHVEALYSWDRALADLDPWLDRLAGMPRVGAVSAERAAE